MIDIFDADGRPSWLREVACRVDEMVCNPKVMARFRRMVRDWDVEHGARAPKSAVDRQGYIRYNAVEVLPVRAMTPAEKYGALAAIHDAVCDGTKRIGPSDRPRRHRKPSITCAVLYSQVKELTDDDRPRIEAVLRDVEDDMAAIALGSTASVDATASCTARRTRTAATPAGAQPITKCDRRLHWLAEAMLLVRDHPDWSNREIANRVGKHPSSLSRSKEYQTAAAMARGNKSKFPRGFIEKDPDTGRTDAEVYADGGEA